MSHKESARWLSHRFFLNFVKLKFLYVVKKMTKPYDPLFWNTRENRVNTRGDILSFSYSMFCAVFYKVWCGRAVIGVVFLVVTSVVRISLLDFFFVNFVLLVFKYRFCSPLLVSVFLILLIIFVKFTYSINRKLYFDSCLIQLTKYLHSHIQIKLYLSYS